MKRMQEADFDKIEESKGSCPPHDVVKLYYFGTHSDYGCTRCKMKSSNIEDFIDELKK